MKYDTDGIYKLIYTAEDSCGNKTEEERTVEVFTLNTRFYSDGTLIINEKSTNGDANIAKHGTVLNTYSPLNNNGTDDARDKYIFSSASQRPWYRVAESIVVVEIGSHIEPTNMGYWFDGCTSLTRIDNIELLDTKNVWRMYNTFSDCEALESLDLSTFDTTGLTTMVAMLSNCKNLKSVNLSSFDTSKVKGFDMLFAYSEQLETVDISNFQMDSAVSSAGMFSNCTKLKTIYVSPSLIVPSGIAGNNMFLNCSQLVGESGTSYASARISGASYARIDNPPDAPGYFTAKSA